MKKTFYLILILITLCQSGFALEYGCEIRSFEINLLATQTLKKFKQQGKSFPDSLVIKSEFEGDFDFTAEPPQHAVFGTHEGFFRPAEDDFYSIIPIPILGISLSRNRNVIYMCAHYESDPSKTHITVYMLRGGKLDPATLGNFFGQIGLGEILEVRPLNASILGISEIRRNFLDLLQWMPIFNLGYDLTDRFQTFLSNTLGEFARIGVERITLTPDYVEIASGVDLYNPENARHVRKIRLRSPENAVEPYQN